MGLNINNTPQQQLPQDEDESAGSKHSADVDPNALLLMLPDMQKISDAKSHAHAVAKNSQDQLVATDKDQKAQSTKSSLATLMSQPELPEGSKESFETYIVALNKQDGNDQPGAAKSATTSVAEQPQAQAGTTTAKGQAQQQAAATVFGEDPAVLLTDSPDASPAVAMLGVLAQTTAAAQGGRLTPDQSTQLSAQANDLLNPNSGALTDTDRSVLVSFVNQLSDFPTTDGAPTTPGKPTTAHSTPTGQATQGSTTTKSGKPADPQSLAMDQLGLSDEVTQLGDQAVAYAQGNNDSLTQDDKAQLQTAAEALIAGGAEGDDLAALQNFLKVLSNFPESLTNPQSPLLLTQQGLDPKLVNLAQYASAMLAGQNGTLTPDEVTTLQNMAQDLMPQLSPADQEVLKTWLGTLGGITLTTPPPVNVFKESMLFGAKPASNPFLSPGIMGMLAPILSEILAVNNDIIRQSSKLKQNMMKLLVSMAKEAYNFAITAGEAKANQLMLDAQKSFTLAAVNIAQAGMTVVAGAVSNREQGKVNNDLKEKQIGQKIDDWVDEKKPNGELVDPSRAKTLADARESVLGKNPPKDDFDNPLPKDKSTGKTANEQIADKIAAQHNKNNKNLEQNELAGINAKYEAKKVKGNLSTHDANLKLDEESDVKLKYQNRPPVSSETFTKLNLSDHMHIAKKSQERMQSSGSQTMTQVMQPGFQALSNIVTGAFDLEKVPSVLLEASANAINQMISQLMQLVTSTIQSASDEMQAAQKNWESFVQLYKDFANTISQSMYRSQ